MENIKTYVMLVDENDEESGIFALSLVEDPAIEQNFVYLSKQKEVKLATVNEDKRVIIGPALIPNFKIPRIDEATGETYFITFPEETVEKAAQLYLKRQMNRNTTIEHSESVDDIAVVESWIIQDSNKDKSNAFGLTYPVGTWMVLMKVQNEEVWSEYVKTGLVKGISLEGSFAHKEVELSKDTEKLAEEKLEMLRQLLEEYLETVTSVSSTYAGQFDEKEKK